MTLVACIPNFSEGRDHAVIDAVVTAMQINDVHVLDVHSDRDHNRSVVTLVGSPQAVMESVFNSTRVAIDAIDMTQHEGCHPCIGAMDVIPFVPYRASRLTQCVDLAHTLGERIGRELGVSVYLYARAARISERKTLAYIRRGNYDQLRQLIPHDDSKIPDFGPRSLGTAGGIAVGARNPLIAFNAYLNTDDVTVAKRNCQSHT